MSERKTISINPAFLSTSLRKSSTRLTIKNKSKKQKPVVTTLAKPNKLRKQLLAKIKDYQKRSEETTENKQKQHEEVSKEFEDEFNKSLGFLQDLAIKQKKPQRKNHTLKKPKPVITVDTELPDDFEQPKQYYPSNYSLHSPQYTQHIQPTQKTPQPKTYEPYKLSLPPKPPYSTLKNGSKPTYREWKYQTQKNNHFDLIPNIHNSNINSYASKPLINIEDKPIVSETSRSAALAQFKTDYKNKNPSKKPTVRIKRTTKTIKYHLGKSKGGDKVSVLIKNKQTRKKIQHEQALLRQKSIVEIKNYLRKKNLLKSGSNAPNDVLREMYEQSILSGNINNTSDNTLMHNFLNE